METNKCSQCKEVRPITDFWKNKAQKSGFCRECKFCSKKRDRRAAMFRYRHQPHVKLKEKVRSYQREYDLEIGVIEAAIAKQNGQCAICKKVTQKLCVDHCHTTGAFRGMLCRSCNTGIGHLHDNPERCIAAAEYLRPPCP